jgi:hypothetical protein
MLASASLCFVLFLLLPTTALPGKCGHTAYQQYPVPTLSVARAHSSTHISSFTRRSLWDPIRIQVYYGPLNLTATMNTRFKEAMGGAMNWFTRSLFVRPIVQRWRLDGMESCGGTVFEGPIVTDAFQADFVLYAIADMEDNGYAGYASWCLAETESNQPILGLFYFNGRSHQKVSDEQILATIIHEISHSLVFSGELYRHYIKPNGLHYPTEELYVVEEVRGHRVRKLALPTVVAKARKAFNCSNLNGLELESDGGGGSAGVHWEKRIMYNDFMTADSYVYDITYTDITLALFADSGWYKVSYRYSNPITWGHLAGCEFLSEKCVSNAKPLTRDFCVKDSELSCDYLGVRIGHCDIDEYESELPKPYQYFSSPYIGGNDYFLDFCPTVKPYRDGDCRDTKGVYLDKTLGENAGYRARCLEGNFDKNDPWMHAGCHQVDCSDSNPTIRIGDSTLICPSEGGDIAVPGYRGTITCPPRSQLCREIPCVNNCHGYGYCDKGTCVCEDGSDDCMYGFAGGSSASTSIVIVGLFLLS